VQFKSNSIAIQNNNLVQTREIEIDENGIIDNHLCGTFASSENFATLGGGRCSSAKQWKLDYIKAPENATCLESLNI